MAGDPESAFGGVLVCNGKIDKATADAINEIFFEVLIAPDFNEDALTVLKSKKNTDVNHALYLIVNAIIVQNILNTAMELVNCVETQTFNDWTTWVNTMIQRLNIC